MRNQCKAGVLGWFIHDDRVCGNRIIDFGLGSGGVDDLKISISILEPSISVVWVRGMTAAVRGELRCCGDIEVTIERAESPCGLIRIWGLELAEAGGGIKEVKCEVRCLFCFESATYIYRHGSFKLTFEEHA